MNYPRCGVPAQVAFVLSYDVEWSQGQGPRMAEKHLQSGLKQFADGWWLSGVAGVVCKQIAKKLVIVGGHEARYPNRRVSRPEAIKFLLKKDFGVDVVECVTSEPNTVGNAKAISDWLHTNSLFVDDAIVVCVYWHGMRASLDLMSHGLHMPVIPAEAAYITFYSTPDERLGARKALEVDFGGGAFAERAAGECHGIADKLLGIYQPLSERTGEKTAA